MQAVDGCQSEVRRRTGRRRGMWLPVVGAGLAVAERVLVAHLGTPATQLRTLRQLGEAWADPIAGVLACLALAVELLVAYLLVVLLLRSLWVVPGALGRVATRVTVLITPVAVRRMLDLLVGSSLLAQASLAVAPAVPSNHGWPAAPTVSAGPGASAGFSASAPSSASSGSQGLPLVPAATGSEPVETRPTPRRASAPLPPWLGGGPSTSAPDPGNGAPADRAYTVEPGDTLWDIAAAHLLPADRSAAMIHRYWQRVYRANRPLIGADPDLIHPGTRLNVPPYRRDRR